MRVMFAVWLPEPFTVAIWMLKSLTIGCTGTPSAGVLAGSDAPKCLVRLDLRPTPAKKGAHYRRVDIAPQGAPASLYRARARLRL